MRTNANLKTETSTLYSSDDGLSLTDIIFFFLDFVHRLILR